MNSARGRPTNSSSSRAITACGASMRRRISLGMVCRMFARCAEELTRGAATWIRICRGTNWPDSIMPDDLQQKLTDAAGQPKNLGEMTDADSVGTVGSADCGDM